MSCRSAQSLTWGRAIAAAFGLALGLQAMAAAGPYDAIYVFGDSLADSGNVYAATGLPVPLRPPYFYGRFSNGPNFADVLASQLGLSQNPIGLNPSLVPGAGVPFPYGSNYAWGGANSGPSILPVGGLSVPSVYRATLPGAGEYPSQLQLYGAYLQGAGIGADPNALYVVWSGGGDLRDAVNYAQTHPATVLTDGEAVVSAAVNNLQATLLTLQGMGAQHVLVPNVPDLGLTPETRDWAANSVPWLTGYASALTGTFNTRLSTMMDGIAGLDLIRFDTYSLFNDINANPSAYGITNVTDPCLTTGASSIYVGGALCANPGGMLYWDNHHPTATVHAVLGAQMFAAAVPEPGTYLMLSIGLAAVLWRRRARRPDVSVAHS